MKANHPRRGAVMAATLGALLVAISAYSAVSQTIAIGTMDHSELVGGPATLMMRTLTIAPNEVLGWHYHPGAGAYTIVASGTLNIEDGCDARGRRERIH